jgi:hypothetical protein
VVAAVPFVALPVTTLRGLAGNEAQESDASHDDEFEQSAAEAGQH